MGWWACTVMGGDGPADVADVIAERLGIDDEDISEEDFHTKLTEHLSLLASDDFIEELTDFDDEHIVKQVIGLFVLHNNLDPNNEHVKTILKNAREGAEQDEWAADDGERKQEMDAYITLIDAYDGHSVEVRSKGLFEAIDEHIASGKTGLVNKNI